jgi:ABC-type multidrug transport system ATPase subunit
LSENAVGHELQLGLSNLEVRRSKRFSVSIASLNIAKGATVLLGRNGAGKTTLLEALAGLSKTTYGHVTIGEETTRDDRSRRLALSRIGYIPQYDALIPRFTVGDFVSYSGWLKGIPRSRLSDAVNAALDTVHMGDAVDRRVRQLSGGMRQRVSIAASLVHDPALWLLDEPTVGLDPEVRSMFRKQISRRARDSTVILSTHLIEDVGELATRCLVLGNGRLIFDGSPRDLERLDDGDHPAPSALERAYLTLSAVALGSA